VGAYFNDLFPDEDDPEALFRSLKEITSDRTDGLDADNGVGRDCFFCEDDGVPRPSPLVLITAAAASREARPFFFFFGMLVQKSVKSSRYS
jgi:hypothetical protein